MGFKAVYRTLMELFPQVDSRILKAVAIEHPKDVSGAAEVVLSEVLPFLTQQSMVDRPLHRDCSPSGLSDRRAENEEQKNMGRIVASSLESKSIAKEVVCKTDLTSATHYSDSTYQEKAPNPPNLLYCDKNVDTNHFPEINGNRIQGNVGSEESMLLVRSQHQEDNVQSDLNIEGEELILLIRSEHQDENVHSTTCQTSKVTSTALSCDENTDLHQSGTETVVPASSLGKCKDFSIQAGHEQTSQIMPISLSQENGRHHSEWKDFDGSSAGNLGRPLSEKGPQVESCLEGTGLEVRNSVIEETLGAAEDDLQSELSATSGGSKISESNQEIKIDFLEDIVEAAKNNKKTLFLAMESIMNMMRQVELQEKIAELAKEEAASAGLDIQAKVEELKQMLKHAKEANDMHAGEVYGEKAILSTEARELQARLISLSDERDKALAILDEMHQTLEVRLAAAEELRRTAEKQKLEKEESARNAYAEQEAIMEKVVQESKFLQEEAEENFRLREFLMDRGRVVDILQGEISVICQDVRLLKERFDEGVLLSKSITSSQTSCILASSGSSIKSVASDGLIPEQGKIFNSPKGRSLASSIDTQSPESQHEEERNNRKELLDDGWEFFENDTEM
ncbi:hypothetical protein P3X46_003093 [Hevea brasiliensis]|uniref:CUE domain-containing protein n=1 Tax=Hevea brasiliensis TaxID=3981 RepID=A0ABQ9N6W2_HEVBR|nr:uncharacterized protein LOC110665493 [Hevea brasiliensis]KAJ9187665.1 hypothetical protein P3X46_003093 [Hevea brasiliensis]